MTTYYNITVNVVPATPATVSELSLMPLSATTNSLNMTMYPAFNNQDPIVVVSWPMSNSTYNVDLIQGNGTTQRILTDFGSTALVLPITQWTGVNLIQVVEKGTGRSGLGTFLNQSGFPILTAITQNSGSNYFVQIGSASNLSEFTFPVENSSGEIEYTFTFGGNTGLIFTEWPTTGIKSVYIESGSNRVNFVDFVATIQ